MYYLVLQLGVMHLLLELGLEVARVEGDSVVVGGGHRGDTGETLRNLVRVTRQLDGTRRVIWQCLWRVVNLGACWIHVSWYSILRLDNEAKIWICGGGRYSAFS